MTDDDIAGAVVGPEDKSWTPLQLLTPEQKAVCEQQAIDCMIYGSSYTRMTFDASSGAFGLAPIKLEGATIKYDPACPHFPPETWRHRLRWRLKRAKYRIRHFFGLSVP